MVLSIPLLFATSTTTYERPPDPTVQEMIISYSLQYDLDPNLMLSIAWEESRFQNVQNYKYTEDYYSAYGVFMIVKSTYRHFCGDNAEDRRLPEKNIECAMKIASESGTHHWSESFDMGGGRGWKYLRYTIKDYEESKL